ncbi:hypothetical protein [Nocardioides ferulae]|uniref:hypothetical protein n=1 Tax=Nocardioides ferulae TaxID=2340821 RepID=UPI000EB01836|nr:hypothetical protein [Nocardioides ferulae]
MYGPPQQPSSSDSSGDLLRGGNRFRSWATVTALVSLGVWTLAEAIPHSDPAGIGGGLALVAAAPFVALGDRAATGESLPSYLPAPLRSALALRVVAGALALAGLLLGFAG